MKFVVKMLLSVAVAHAMRLDQNTASAECPCDCISREPLWNNYNYNYDAGVYFNTGCPVNPCRITAADACFGEGQVAWARNAEVAAGKEAWARNAEVVAGEEAWAAQALADQATAVDEQAKAAADAAAADLAETKAMKCWK